MVGPIPSVWFKLEHCVFFVFLFQLAMGSLPEGTKCFYCAVNLAGYIPDGADGPMCGDCQHVGWKQYVANKFRALEAMLAKHSLARDMWTPIADQIAEFLFL